jgi:hypothetical protein
MIALLRIVQFLTALIKVKNKKVKFLQAQRLH